MTPETISQSYNRLRGLHKRNEYRKVILPQTVIRRLEVLLETTKNVVRNRMTLIDKTDIASLYTALYQPAGQAIAPRIFQDNQ